MAAIEVEEDEIDVVEKSNENMEKKEKPPTLFREFFFKLRQIILEEINIIKV